MKPLHSGLMGGEVVAAERQGRSADRMWAIIACVVGLSVVFAACAEPSPVSSSAVRELAEAAIGQGFDFDHDFKVVDGPDSGLTGGYLGTWDGEGLYARWDHGAPEDAPASLLIIGSTAFEGRFSICDTEGIDCDGKGDNGLITLRESASPVEDSARSYRCLESDTPAVNNVRALLGGALMSETVGRRDGGYQFEFAFDGPSGSMQGQGIAYVEGSTLRRLEGTSTQTNDEEADVVLSGVIELSNVGNAQRARDDGFSDREAC